MDNIRAANKKRRANLRKIK